jgi:Transposase IS66 family
MRLPILRGRRHAGASVADRGRIADRGHGRPGAGVQVCRSSAAVPAGPDLWPPGIDLDRSTLADWVGQAAWHLRPLHARLLVKLRQRSKLFADETTMPVLDPGRGSNKTGQLWAYAADDRPRGGADPPGVVYVYAPDRKAERPIAHLDGFKGSCRSTAMPAAASSPSAATSSLRSAGRTCGATSMNSPPLARRPLRARRSSELPSFTQSRRTSVAAAPRSGVSSGSRKASRSPMHSSSGCAQNSA